MNLSERNILRKKYLWKEIRPPGRSAITLQAAVGLNEVNTPLGNNNQCNELLNPGLHLGRVESCR